MSEVKRSPCIQKAVGVKIQIGVVGWGLGVRGNGVSYLKWCGLSNSTPEVALD